MHLAREGPFEKVILWAEKAPAVLFDVASRRTWLVPTLGVMLHIIQTRLHLGHYSLWGSNTELVAAKPEGTNRHVTRDAAFANRWQPLYEGYYFQDAIFDLWSQIIRLKEEFQSTEKLPGFTLHGTMRSKLHGWEFMSLIEEKNFRQRQLNIAKSSGGWVDLAADIDALILFGTGFNDVIRPVPVTDSLCGS